MNLKSEDKKDKKEEPESDANYYGDFDNNNDNKISLSGLFGSPFDFSPYNVLPNVYVYAHDDNCLFLLAYNALAFYFSSKMIRLVLMLSPAAAAASGVAIACAFRWYVSMYLCVYVCIYVYCFNIFLNLISQINIRYK